MGLRLFYRNNYGGCICKFQPKFQTSPSENLTGPSTRSNQYLKPIKAAGLAGFETYRSFKRQHFSNFQVMAFHMVTLYVNLVFAYFYNLFRFFVEFNLLNITLFLYKYIWIN